MTDREKQHILNQIGLLLEISDAPQLMEVPTSEVVAVAGAVLEERESHADAPVWPKDNLRGEQNRYLENLLAAALQRAGGKAIPEARREVVTNENDKWEGGVPPDKDPGVYG